MADIKDWAKHPVWSGLIVAALTSAGGIILTTIKGWWPMIGAALVTVWHRLGESSLHLNWLMLVLWLCAAFTLLVIGVLLYAAFERSPDPSEPGWKAYLSDHFFNLKWYWRLDANGRVYGIYPVCPDCECQVVPHEEMDYPSQGWATKYHCDVCNTFKSRQHGTSGEIEQRVELRIQKNLRTGEWKQRPPTSPSV